MTSATVPLEEKEDKGWTKEERAKKGWTKEESEEKGWTQEEILNADLYKAICTVNVIFTQRYCIVLFGKDIKNATAEAMQRTADAHNAYIADVGIESIEKLEW